MKTLLDFNAKVGREDVSTRQLRNESLHEISNNGVRLVNFATSSNLTVKSTMFPHHYIHKYTWMSPNGTIKAQTDHILITGEGILVYLKFDHSVQQTVKLSTTWWCKS
jgi:hypothetical protein